MIQALALFSTLLCVQDFDDFNEWNAWKDMGDGSWIVVETVSKTGGTETKMEVKTNRDSMTDEAITLSSTTTIFMKGVDIPPSTATHEVKKPGKDGTNTYTDCPKCKKPYKGHSTVKTTKDQKLTIDGKEINCTLMESEFTDCESDKVSSSSKMWLSKDVPGWMVKMESKTGGSETTMTVSKFEKK